METLKFLTDLKQSGGFDVNLEYQLDKAIEELEALQSRSCEGCSRLDFDEVEKVYKCCIDVSDDVRYLYGEAVIIDIKDFCCNQFQHKE